MADAALERRYTPRNPVKIGERFGRLTVIGEGGYSVTKAGVRKRLVTVKCDCGTEKIITPGPLRPGIVVSCGCRLREVARERAGKMNVRHGDCRVGRRAPEYGVYRTMLSRCYNPNVEKYPLYGGRGIKVCDRWRGDGGYENFILDMGRRPNGCSIEREDSDGDYEPSNCRWATSREQANNTSRNRVIEWGGKAQTLAEWSREIGVKPITIHMRLKDGWSVERALTTPLRRMKNNNRP